MLVSDTSVVYHRLDTGQVKSDQLFVFPSSIFTLDNVCGFCRLKVPLKGCSVFANEFYVVQKIGNCVFLV